MTRAKFIFVFSSSCLLASGCGARFTGASPGPQYCKFEPVAGGTESVVEPVGVGLVIPAGFVRKTWAHVSDESLRIPEWRFQDEITGSFTLRVSNTRRQ